MTFSFAHSRLPQLIVGPGSAGRLPALAKSMGRSVLLVSGGRALEAAGHLADLEKGLVEAGLRVHHCCIPGEPSPAMVDAAVAGCASKQIDVVVAAGGGSVIDAGKAIAAMLCETGSVVDYLEGVGSRTPPGRTLPLIALPTTAGTGSEATKNAVISQVGADGFKKSLRHDNYIPRVAILDATLALSVPPAVTAACGMDALTQLIEAYVSTHASPLTDALAMEGLRHLLPALPEACGAGSGDLEVRSRVSYGAFLSGVTLANAGLGVVHGVAGPLGGMLAIPHGVACANLLPGAIQATAKNLKADGGDHARLAMEKYARVGRLLGAATTDAHDGCRHLIATLNEWLAALSIPRLGRFGLTRAHMDRLVSLSGNKNNPLPLSADQIREILGERL